MIGHATPLADWVLVLPVLLGLAGAALLLVLRRALVLQAWLALGLLLAILVCDGVLLGRVVEAGPLSMTMGKWLPPFGISFTADAMGAAFALAAALVGFAVVLQLMLEAPVGAVRDGVYPLLLLLVAGVSGAFLTGDLFNLYVWFEVMLIASFGLMALAGNPLQLEATVKYGVLNILATTLFLVALGLLYGLLGTLNMADIIGVAAKAEAGPLVAVTALLMLAFGMKAAVFPVNAWLPASYHAPPAAISALLGGLLTKVGVYALIRLLVLLVPLAAGPLRGALEWVAIATMILGPLSAIAETQLRRAVGFLLIGGIGLALGGVADGSHAAVAGSVAYVVHAVLTLAGLYLMAGVVERLTGEADTRRMGGLYATHPMVALLCLALFLAVAGVPPFLGFWPKLELLTGFIGSGHVPLAIGLLASSLLSLIAGARLWSHIFWRAAPEGMVAGKARLAPSLLLAGTVLILGVAPGYLLKVADSAATGLLDPARYVAAVGLAP